VESYRHLKLFSSSDELGGVFANHEDVPDFLRRIFDSSAVLHHEHGELYPKVEN